MEARSNVQYLSNLFMARDTLRPYIAYGTNLKDMQITVA